MKKFWRKEDGEVSENIIENGEAVGYNVAHYICSIFYSDYDSVSGLCCEGRLEGVRRGGSLLVILEVLFILRAVGFTWLATAARYHG